MSLCVSLGRPPLKNNLACRHSIHSVCCRDKLKVYEEVRPVPPSLDPSPPSSSLPGRTKSDGRTALTANGIHIPSCPATHDMLRLLLLSFTPSVVLPFATVQIRAVVDSVLTEAMHPLPHRHHHQLCTHGPWVCKLVRSWICYNFHSATFITCVFLSC